jgi:hypothetical protein
VPPSDASRGPRLNMVPRGCNWKRPASTGGTGCALWVNGEPPQSGTAVQPPSGLLSQSRHLSRYAKGAPTKALRTALSLVPQSECPFLGPFVTLCVRQASIGTLALYHL